jgi:sensor histidine kinase YesM
VKNENKFLKKTYKSKKSIRTQLFVIFITINFVTLSLCTLILYSVTKNIITKDYKNSNLKNTQQLSHNISNVLNDANNISMLIGTNQEIQNQMVYNSISGIAETNHSKQVFQLLNNYMINFTYIDSIYCYAENGAIIGVDKISNFFLPASNDKNMDKNIVTINSAPIKVSIMHPNQQIFLNNYSKKDFNYYKSDTVDINGNENYISDVRGYSYLTGFRHSLTVCININESYIRSIYNNNEVNKDYIIYLINADGKIASHFDSLQINKTSPSFDKVKMKDNSGAFIYKEDSISKQVVYSRVPDSSFILVTETPVNTIIRDVSMVRQIFIVLLFTNIIFAFILSMIFIRRITNPLSKLTYLMYRMEQGDLEHKLTDLPNNEIGILNLQFNKMSSSITELINKNKEIEEEKHKLEIQNLQARINPHFLHNTLNTLKWMALIVGAKEVANGLTAIGNLLYPIYKNSGILWTIREEYSFLQDFIKIMNYRYGGGVIVNLIFSEDIMEYMVLTFTLQPILENSFLHGLKVKNTSGEISVKGWAEETDVCFEIQDDGNGIDEEKLANIKLSLEKEREIYSTDGIGISNVSRRIKLHFGNHYGLNITSNIGIGTRILIRIPKIDNIDAEL